MTINLSDEMIGTLRAGMRIAVRRYQDNLKRTERAVKSSAKRGDANGVERYEASARRQREILEDAEDALSMLQEA